MAQLRYRVYRELGFLPESEEMIDHDQDDERSTHFGAYVEGRLVGTIRLISGQLDSLPITKQFNLNCSLQQVNVVEVSRLAVEGNEKHAVLLSLFKIAIDWSFSVGIVHWYFALDEQMHAVLVRKYKVKLLDLGDPKFYMGSMTQPSYADLRVVVAQLRQDNPAFGSFLSYRGPAFESC